MVVAPQPDSIKAPNPVKGLALFWWGISLLLMLGLFSPAIVSLFGGEAGDWSYPTVFVCLVFGITAIVVAVQYTKRARLVGRMLKQEKLLAHWVYTAEEWNGYSASEHVEDRREKRNIGLLISIVAIIIGVVLTVLEPKGWLIFVLAVLGIVVVMNGAAWLAVWMRHRRNVKYRGEAFISRDAVYLNRELHMWKGFGAALEEVGLEEGDSRFLLKLVYSVPNRFQRQYVNVRVPVPGDQTEQARVVVADLGRLAKRDKDGK